MGRCIGFSAALWCHLVFTHPTAMASNFRSETIHVVTRLAWSAVGYGERGSFGGTLLCVNYSSARSGFVWGEKLFLPENWAKSRKPNRCFKWASFSIHLTRPDPNSSLATISTRNNYRSDERALHNSLLPFHHEAQLDLPCHQSVFLDASEVETMMLQQIMLVSRL